MIVRKILKITATRCHILKLKCTKFERSPAPLAEPELGAILVMRGNVGEGRRREGRGKEERKVGRGKRRGRHDPDPTTVFARIRSAEVWFRGGVK